MSPASLLSPVHLVPSGSETPQGSDSQPWANYGPRARSSCLSGPRSRKSGGFSCSPLRSFTSSSVNMATSGNTAAAPSSESSLRTHCGPRVKKFAHPWFRGCLLLPQITLCHRNSVQLPPCLLHHLIKHVMWPWLVRLSGQSVSLWTEGSQVRFRSRACT
uniref:Uncharacterized protein n=1 Tax=Myotis myotis TaxID=51298 RepID=A0A7J7V3F1_MYOMY|nr:hypothetical protein mMyoMyo1_008434 [Myotis myotis]